MLTIVFVAALVFTLAVTIAVSLMNAVGWPSYAIRWQRVIGNAMFRLVDHMRATREPDGVEVEPEPDPLALMRNNSLDEELLRLIAGLRSPYDPARHSDEADAPSTLEF